MSRESTIVAAVTLLAAGAIAAASAGAAPGSPDKGFAGDGRVSVSVGQRVVAGEAIALPGGKLLVGGHGVRPGGALDGGSLVLVQRSRNGGADSSFGTGGRVVTSLPGGPVTVRALARQPDGRLLVAGSIGRWDTDRDVMVARLTAAGALDPTFGSQGVRRLDLGPTAEAGEALAVQPDGALVVGGWVDTSATGPSRGEAFVARLRPDGANDPAFGSAGLVRLRSSGPTASMSAAGVVVETDGRIAVAGTLSDSSAQRSVLFVARLSGSGETDTGLAPFGYRTFGGASNTMRDMSRDPRTGRLVLVGETRRAGGTRFLAARLTGALEPDPAFGRDGVVAVNVPRGRPDVALSGVVDGAGRVVVAGTSVRGRGGRFVLARLTASGRRDERFGRRGLVRSRFGRGWDVARDVALVGRGRIAAVGSDGRFSLDSGGRTVDIAAYRAGPAPR